MGTPSANQYFEAIHTGPGDPTSPNLFTAAELVAGSFSSAAVSSATSTAVSTVNAAAPDSSSISQAKSQAVSAATNASIADSKAVSVSGNTSVADSKAQSNSLNVSVADSKAVSVATATPTLTVIANSQAVSTADSKAVSAATAAQTLPSGRTITGLTNYLTDNAVFNVKDYLATTASLNNTAAFQNCMNALSANGGGIFYIPEGNWIADPPAMVANCHVRGAGMTRTTLTALTINGAWNAIDVSDIELSDLTFVGQSASGTNTTDHAVFFRAVAADIINVAVRRCLFRQFKSTDSCVRIAGNGDLVTPATKFARRIVIEGCTVKEFYDTNPASLAVAAYGIYFFGGVKEVWCQRNYVDGTNGKHGIIAQSEANDVHIEDNIVTNCGVANAQFGYGITCYSAYTTVSVVDAFICRNTIVNSVKAGIYLASIGKYVVSHNILDTCDTISSGLGNVGVGAIMANNSTDTASCGAGVISDNTIIDPGFCAIYINTASFGRAPCTVTGNSCKVTTAVARTGVVLWGRDCIITGNEFRGFQTGVFLYNTADNLVGDATISDNSFDATTAPGSPTGISQNSVSFIVNPLVIKGNRFKANITGMNLVKCTDVVISGNFFTGATSPIVLNPVTRATVEGNQADGGTTGIQIILTPATASARGVLTGNIMTPCTTPYSGTKNTGRLIVKGNDFNLLPFVGGNNGDTSVSFVPTLETNLWQTTLTAARTQTLNVSGALIEGDCVTCFHQAATPGNFTFTVSNGGPGGSGAGFTYVVAANSNGWAKFQYNGTDWVCIGGGIT